MKSFAEKAFFDCSGIGICGGMVIFIGIRIVIAISIAIDIVVAGVLRLLLILWLQGSCDCRDIPLSDRPKLCEKLTLSRIAQTDGLLCVSLKNKKNRILREFGWTFGG